MPRITLYALGGFFQLTGALITSTLLLWLPLNCIALTVASSAIGFVGAVLFWVPTFHPKWWENQDKRWGWWLAGLTAVIIWGMLVIPQLTFWWFFL